MSSVVDSMILRQTCHLKYGGDPPLGWGPRLRQRFGYFTPDDFYDATVFGMVREETRWMDVGCGREIFPGNPATAEAVARRCKLLVGLDPSENIFENHLCHERFRGYLEEYPGEARFDLITLRMVAEHITDPGRVVAALNRLCRPGGRVVIYTVFKWSPLTLVSAMVPFSWHHRIKRLFWRTDERDTFPTAYAMNTREDLRKLFEGAGLTEVAFSYLDDCRTFSRWRLPSLVELTIWKALKGLGLNYPEVCLLGIYQKSNSGTDSPILQDSAPNASPSLP